MPPHAESPPAGSEILKAWAEHEGGTALPVLPEPAPEPGAETDEMREQRLRLRRFCAGEPDDDGLEQPGPDMLPALLLPFRDPHRVRHDYPLLLPPHGGNGQSAAPLSAALAELAGRFAPGPDDARILKDNFPRLEQCVRESLDGSSAPVEAVSLISRAARLTEDALTLKGDSGRRFHEDLEKLVAAVPEGGALLPLGEHTALQLFLHVAVRHAAERRAALEADVAGLRNRLGDLLRLDDMRRAGADEPETLSRSMGDVAGTHLDPAALARVVGTVHGTEPMDAARRDRVEKAVATFERFLGGEQRPTVLVVHHDEIPEVCREADARWRQVERGEVCGSAAALFDEIAAPFGSLFAAMRLARLELAGEPTRHDASRETLHWRSFAPDELRALPPVVAVECADHVAGAGMLDLSRLLRSGRTVNVLVTVQPASNPGIEPDDDPLGSYHFELGYLGVSHREALVNQSSAARPRHLLAGIGRGLQATRTALHVVASGLTTGGDVSPLGGWLHAGAALEGRAHPLYHYDPEAGETWARRLDFSENPQPDADWPVYTLPCRRADGDREGLDLAFTFADFALMEPAYRRHFRIVPAGVTGDEFMTLDAYLALPPEPTHGRVPCIWAADTRGGLHRLAVSRRLAFACRDRLDYWRTLQELAGVRSEYVREALDRQRDELESAFDAERARLDTQHAAELEAAREDATGDAMRRLAEALLATDISSLAAPTAAAPAPAPAAAPPAAEPAAEAPPETDSQPQPEAEPAAAVESEEPWIDSALCTSCNDCMGINARVFVYDANKQATIGDARAGTYDELVRAAEICPARCIHPGLPMNPDEPNLDALIERAKPFNV